jgi:ABC-type transport system involved in cytochrome bd biosynthesis fused ATPase/permease subunit
MILDEATASLDAISERAIKAAIEDLRGHVTFVVIAHQGALLSDVDHLVALQMGEVLFEGHPSQIDANSSVRVLSTAFQDVAAKALC